MEFQEIKQETREQKKEADEMGEEVEAHKQEVALLKEAVSDLQAAQSAVDSEGLRETLREAEQARQATELRMEELRAQRDRLLEENKEMQQIVETSLERKKQACDKIRLVTQGMNQGAPAAEAYDSMQTALVDDLDATVLALHDLQNARVQLESIDLRSPG